VPLAPAPQNQHQGVSRGTSGELGRSCVKKTRRLKQSMLTPETESTVLKWLQCLLKVVKSLRNLGGKNKEIKVSSLEL